MKDISTCVTQRFLCTLTKWEMFVDKAKILAISQVFGYDKVFIENSML